MAKMRNLDISNTRVERTVDLSEVFSERINWVIGNENEKKKKKKKKKKNSNKKNLPFCLAVVSQAKICLSLSKLKRIVQIVFSNGVYYF